MKKHITFIALWAVAALTFAQQKEVSLTELYKDWSLYPSTPDELQSAPDGTHYNVISDSGICIETFNYSDGKKTGTIVNLNNVKGDKPTFDSIDGYEVSATGDFVLIWGNSSKIYRHSFTADYYILDVLHNQLIKLTKDGREQEATFSPNGSMVSYVKNNNLYIYKIRYQSSSTVTTDGQRNKVINGIPDWVNEEEFSIQRSYAWSPDSKKLAYVKYDESEVPEYSFPVYAASHPTFDAFKLYPGQYKYKYPKAGEKNATVSVHIFDLDTRTTKDIDLGKEEKYVPRILWTGEPDMLCVIKMNRLQNRMDLISVNAKSTVTSTLLTERNDCYIEESAIKSVTFINEGKDFILTSERDGWNHLYWYGTNGVEKKKLTEGDYDVTDLYGIDAKGTTVFYQAAQKNAMNREVYAYDLKKQTTKAIANEDGTNRADFGVGCNFFVKSHSSVTQVPRYTVCDSKGRELRTIEDNADLKLTMEKKVFVPREFMTVKGVDGIDLNAWIVKPADFNPNKKYPVLIIQYSGPNSQEVLNKWEVDWEQILATKGYIVMSVDPRGTGARGEKFRKCTYKQLGKYESDDQIAAAKYIGTLPYVDANRIGIWGWSFGGFMTSLCMCKSDVFKMGIAVAPVTNWRYYDTIYAERYLRKPDQNESGYDDNSPTTHAANLKGKYLIVAGTADDNVHYQNQMEMVEALVQADVQFDMFTYPNRNHSIYGGNVRYHLYVKMINYVLENL